MRGFAVLLLLFTPLTSVSGQDTGSLIRRPPAQVDDRGPDGARRTMRDFAGCVVRSSPVRIRRTLALPVSDPQYQAGINALATDECLSTGVLTMAPGLIRGALFEAVYLREYGREGPRDFSLVPTQNLLPEYGLPIDSFSETIVGLSNFGICVARAAPQNSISLMHSGIGTAAEATAVAALNPTFSGCLRQGQTFRFSRAVVRGVIAEGLVLLSDNAQRRAP